MEFKPLSSYNTVRNECIQVSLQGKESWRKILNMDNLALIQYLLKIALKRRIKPTNQGSKGSYGNALVRYACTKRYMDAAIIILGIDFAFGLLNLMWLLGWNGVGFQIVLHVGMFLIGNIEWDNHEDDEIDMVYLVYEDQDDESGDEE